MANDRDEWMPIITLENEGPKCPYCGRQFTADEGSYFDDDYTEETCDECEQTFDVEVCTSTVWRCQTRDLLDGEQSS